MTSCFSYACKECDKKYSSQANKTWLYIFIYSYIFLQRLHIIQIKRLTVVFSCIASMIHRSYSLLRIHCSIGRRRSRISIVLDRHFSWHYQLSNNFSEPCKRSFSPTLVCFVKVALNAHVNTIHKVRIL